MEFSFIRARHPAIVVLVNAAATDFSRPLPGFGFSGVEPFADGQFIWVWWYQFQVTDNISVTPALFYLSRPMGDLTPDGSTFQQLGGLIKTTFVF